MNEVRLIDANALKDAHIECPDNISFFDFGEIVERFLQTIDEQPTVDAVPVEWIKAKIESLKSQGNEFLSFAAITMQAMLNCYRVEGERRSE